jgi:DNA primase
MNPAKLKLPASIKLALTLLVQNPDLVSQINEPMPEIDMPGYGFLKSLVRMIKQKPAITTGGLLERWRDTKEGDFLGKLASSEQLAADDRKIEEFSDAMKRIMEHGLDNEINHLLAKAVQEGLSDDEKTTLAGWIAQKKTIVNLIGN